MRTTVLSDLHLGARSGADLLSCPALRERVLSRLADSDRVVLLGDVVELRDRPGDDAIARAEPVFADLSALDAELIVAPGNHDWQLDPWLPARDRSDGGLGLEQLRDPTPGGPLARLAAAVGRPVRLAYPGLWLREDVYATHGHYLDRHSTTPTFENLGAAVTARALGRPADEAATPDDYEAVLAPLYAFAEAMAQGHARGGHSRPSVALFERLAASPWRAAALGGIAIPALVAALNRAGLGPFRADLRGDQLERAGLEAMAAVVAALKIQASWVVFGHTHRPGPLPGDPVGWGSTGGTRLVNTGSWVLERGAFGSSAPGGPWYPGTVVELEDTGPPRVRRLLDGDEIAALSR